MSSPTVRSRQRVTRDEVIVRGGAVAATRHHESLAGVECLQEGGNAVDAAVAAAFVACVIEPFSTSIGGCGFMLVADPANGSTMSIEFPTRAPAAARPDMFRIVDDAPGFSLGTHAVEDDANSNGMLAVGVPGTVAGLVEAHRRFGRLPLSRVVESAVDLGRRGFRSDPYYETLVAPFAPLLERYSPGSALLIDGRAPMALLAERVVQRELADAIEEIGRDGGASFHRGDVAHAIVDDVRDRGGLLTVDDLASYRPIVTTPLTRRYRGHDVAVPTSPCGGWTVLQTLGLLERFDLPALDRDGPARLHLVVETLRRAFADRYAHLGDPDHVAVPLDAMLSDAYLDDLVTRVDPDTAAAELRTERQPWVALADPPLHDPWAYAAGEAPAASGGSDGGRHGTVHVTAADADGMLVTCTHTIGDVFGSKSMAGPGVLLNGGMQWFSPAPGAVNSIAGGKRPLANMAPVLVSRDGRPVLGAGAFGGRRIISAMVQIVSDVVDHGRSAQQACESPRLDASERTTIVDDRVGDAVLDDLRRRGHLVETVREDHNLLGVAFANATAVALPGDGTIRCGVDAIRPCEAIGY